METTELLTSAEIATYLKLKPEAVRALVKKQNMPHYRIAKSLRFKLAEVEQWMKRGQQSQVAQHEQK
jgi:excisionase family DNA binding protein